MDDFDFPQFPGGDDEIKKGIQAILSPVDAEGLPVASPPTTAPRTGPGQSTPRTGSLATAPQQAQPKVSGPPMIPGVAARPETLNLGPSTLSQQPQAQPVDYAKLMQMRPGGSNPAPSLPAMAPPTARSGGGEPQVVTRDLNGNAVATTPRSALPATRPAIAGVLAARQPAAPAPLNLGPATLTPQLQAQQKSYGDLMKMRAQYPGPASPGSMPSSLGSPTSAPSLPATASTVAPADQQKLAQDQAKLDYYQRTGSGIDQVRNRWGRGFLRGLDIAGSVIAPGVTALVPGTTLHNQMLQGIEQERIANDEDQIQKAATVADTNSQRAYRDQQAAFDAARAGADAPRPVTREEAAAMGDPSLEGQSWTPKGITATIQVNARNQGLLKRTWDQTVTAAAKAGLIASKDENGQVTFAPDPNSARTLGAAQAQRAKDADTYGLKGVERQYFILTGKMRDPESQTNIRIPSADSQEYDDWKKALGHPPTTDDLANYRKGNRGSVDPTDRDVSTLVGYRKQIADQYDKLPDPDSDEGTRLKQLLRNIDGRIAAAAEAQDRARSNPQSSGNTQSQNPSGRTGFVTQKGSHLRVGDPVNVRGRRGTVTGYNAKTGRAQVQWADGQ